MENFQLHFACRCKEEARSRWQDLHRIEGQFFLYNRWRGHDSVVKQSLLPAAFNTAMHRSTITPPGKPERNVIVLLRFRFALMMNLP